MLFQILFPYRLLQNIEYSPCALLLYSKDITISLLEIYFIYSSVYANPNLTLLGVSPLSGMVHPGQASEPQGIL